MIALASEPPQLNQSVQQAYEAVPVLWRHGPLWFGGQVLRQRISAQAGGDIMLIQHTSQKLIMISRYHYILKTMISRYHYILFFAYIPRDIMGF